MTQPKPIPVVRIEQFDGSHEHPDIQALRAENRQLRQAQSLAEIWQLLGLDNSYLLAEVERLRSAEEGAARLLSLREIVREASLIAARHTAVNAHQSIFKLADLVVDLAQHLRALKEPET